MSAGSPMDDIAMFVDVTFKMTARPGNDQRVMYNGYKTGHGYKWQGVTSPDGHLALCHGPVECCHTDGHILDWSGLEELIKNRFHGYGGWQLFVYRDPAYSEMDVIISGQKKVQNYHPSNNNSTPRWHSYDSRLNGHLESWAIVGPSSTTSQIFVHIFLLSAGIFASQPS